MDQLSGRHVLIRGSRALLRSEVMDTVGPAIAGRLRVTPEGCLEYTGAKTPEGYGVIRIEQGRKGRLAYVHRVAVALSLGEVPAGMVVDHLCRNRACANIWHLRVVTPEVNTPGIYGQEASPE